MTYDKFLPAEVSAQAGKIKNCNSGFTLVEVLIAIGIMALLIAIGLPLSSGTYGDYLMISERDQFLAVLRKARNQALTNLHASPHGVHVASASYTIFEGNTYAGRVISLDETISRYGGIIASGSADIVFQPHSGRTASASFMLIRDDKKVNIIVNQEGMIDW